MSEEKCIACDGLTGRSGRGEDSLYLESSEHGPFCADCYEGARWADSVLTSLRARVALLVEVAEMGKNVLAAANENQEEIGLSLEMESALQFLDAALRALDSPDT